MIATIVLFTFMSSAMLISFSRPLIQIIKTQQPAYSAGVFIGTAGVLLFLADMLARNLFKETDETEEIETPDEDHDEEPDYSNVSNIITPTRFVDDRQRMRESDDQIQHYLNDTGATIDRPVRRSQRLREKSSSK